MAQLSKLSFVGMGKEVTLGTAVSPTIYVPVKTLTTEDTIAFAQDDSLFNNQSLVRGQYAGEKDSMFDFDGMLYPDHIGTFLVGCGLADTVTGTSAPYTHSFALTASSQPPTWTLWDYDTVETHAFPGQIVDQFDLTIDAKGAIKQAIKFKGWPSASSHSNTFSGPAFQAFMGWEASSSLNGIGTSNLVSFGLTIKRSSETIHTLNNTQTPYTTFAGPIEVNVKCKALFENDTLRNLFLNNTQGTLKVNLIYPSGANPPTLTLTSTVNAFTKAALDRTQKYVQIDMEASNVYNATDGGPFAATLTNAVSTGY